jgi:hypothetical protein
VLCLTLLRACQLCAQTLSLCAHSIGNSKTTQTQRKRIALLADRRHFSSWVWPRRSEIVEERSSSTMPHSARRDMACSLMNRPRSSEHRRQRLRVLRNGEMISCRCGDVRITCRHSIGNNAVCAIHHHQRLASSESRLGLVRLALRVTS